MITKEELFKLDRPTEDNTVIINAKQALYEKIDRAIKRAYKEGHYCIRFNNTEYNAQGYGEYDSNLWEILSPMAANEYANAGYEVTIYNKQTVEYLLIEWDQQRPTD